MLFDLFAYRNKSKSWDRPAQNDSNGKLPPLEQEVWAVGYRKGSEV
jgi:hypothetical protein